MMIHVRSMLLLVLAFFILSCGNSPTVNVDILVATNATPSNLMESISEAIQNGQSKGVYFRFAELNFCPTSIEDQKPGGMVLEADTSQLGADPVKSSFTIDTSTLDPEKLYQVRMLAFSSNGTPTHIGNLNCPLSIKYPDLNPLTICFGNISPDPFCAGLPTCPQGSTPLCNCNLTPEQAQACN